MSLKYSAVRVCCSMQFERRRIKLYKDLLRSPHQRNRANGYRSIIWGGGQSVFGIRSTIVIIKKKIIAANDIIYYRSHSVFVGISQWFFCRPRASELLSLSLSLSLYPPSFPLSQAFIFSHSQSGKRLL